VLRESKRHWQFKWRGRIEKEFLFETVRAKALLPFMVKRSQLVFLPLTDHKDGIRILQTDELLKSRKLYAAQWLRGVEQAWKPLFPNKSSLTEGLASNQALLAQEPKKEMVVLCSVIGSKQSAALYTSDAKARSHDGNGFIANHETYYYYPQSADEGDYLCAALNSRPVTEKLQNLRSNPSGGIRAFHRFPTILAAMPRFDPDDPAHQTLAECGRECRIAHGDSGEKVNGSRKQTFRTFLSRIDKTVDSLLG
ncbi:MAG TPA: hypothetical protein VMT62_08150, partial [Syntrophorhabdaceae bacterium]|nr:hypothetical protein [Syntrophorhabdaceae bacterium]